MNLSFSPTDGLTVALSNSEKLWAFRGDFKMPAHKIKGAWLGMPKSSWRELRAPGSFVPGFIKAGTYHTPRGTEFWYVTKKKCHPVTIELEGCKRYTRLVLGFEDPSVIGLAGLQIGSPPEGIETMMP